MFKLTLTVWSPNVYMLLLCTSDLQLDYSLTDDFCKNHFLVGLLLREVGAALQEFREIRQISIQVLKSLMMKHTFDDRYASKVSPLLPSHCFLLHTRARVGGRDLDISAETFICFSEPAGEVGHAVLALVWSAPRERQQAECERSIPVHHQPLQPCKEATWWFVCQTTIHHVIKNIQTKHNPTTAISIPFKLIRYY